MHPALLIASGTQLDLNSYTGTLVSSNQTRQPATGGEVGFWNMLTAPVTCVFNNSFPKRPSIVITLPKDMLERICTNITEDKDLCSFTLTCTTLSEMRTFPQIQPRIRDFKITRLFFFGRTIACHLLNERATQLVLAANDRALSHSECACLGIAPTRPLNARQQAIDFDHKLTAERHERDFYELFKTRCVELNVYKINNDFILYVTSVIGELKKNSRSPNITDRKTLCVKLNTTLLHFKKKIFNDLIVNFASQPIAMLTPCRFKEQVNELKALSPHDNIADIEASLRKANSTIDNQFAMVALAAAYMDPAPNNPKIKELKLVLKAELEFYKAEIQAKIEELCGENMGAGSNGTIHTAYCAMTKAQTELDDAADAFRAVFGAPPDSALHQLLALDTTNTPFEPPQALLVAKNTAFEAAKAEFDNLRADLAIRAVWTGPNITGGTFHEVEIKLANLEAIARESALKLGEFYKELRRPVENENIARSKALHAIIG